MSLLKQDIIKKGRVNKLLKLESELNIRENKEYKVETNKDSTIYTKAAEGQLPGLYYLVS